MVSVLEDFLDTDADSGICELLLTSIRNVSAQQRRLEFTFNVCNVLIDFDTASVTVGDELDVTREQTVGLVEFESALQSCLDRNR